MKISRIIALSAVIASTSTQAFQARVNNNAISSGQKSQTVENRISDHDSYYKYHQQISAAGVCAAVAVSGCHCAFCSLLRGGSTDARAF